MEKIILTKENIEKNRDEILKAYAQPSKKFARLPIPTKKQRKLLGMGRDQGKATAKYIRITPRKMKIVIDLIKGKSIDEAYAILMYTPKAASPILTRVRSSSASCQELEDPLTESTREQVTLLSFSRKEYKEGFKWVRKLIPMVYA